MYSSTASDEASQLPTNLGPTDNPTYAALSPDTRKLFDNPLYASTCIDTTNSATYAEPGANGTTVIDKSALQYSIPYDKPADLSRSTNVYESIKPAAVDSTASVTARGYEEPVPLSQDIPPMNMYESINNMANNGTIANPLYQDTMPQALEIHNTAVPPVNNPMYQETSGVSL